MKWTTEKPTVPGWYWARRNTMNEELRTLTETELRAMKPGDKIFRYDLKVWVTLTKKSKDIWYGVFPNAKINFPMTAASSFGVPK